MTETNSAQALDEAAETRPRRGLWLVRGGVVVAVLVAIGFGYRAYDEQRDLVTAAEEAETAGRGVALSMLDYDYRSLDQDFAWPKELGTRSFQGIFAADAETTKELAAVTKATSVAEVVGSGVSMESPSRATVLLAVNSTITEEGRASPIRQRWRIELSMERHDGKWLVDVLELL